MVPWRPALPRTVIDGTAAFIRGAHIPEIAFKSCRNLEMATVSPLASLPIVDTKTVFNGFVN